MSNFTIYSNLITSQEQLTKIKQEQNVSVDQEFNQSKQEQQFQQLSDENEQLIIKLLQEQYISYMNQESNFDEESFVKKKIKKDKSDLIPYKSQDNRRRAISLEFQINECRKFNKEMFSTEFIPTNQHKDNILKQIEKIFSFQDKIHPKIIQDIIERLQSTIYQSIDSLEQINNIPNQIHDPQILEFNHLIDFQSSKNYTLFLNQASQSSIEFQKRFNPRTTEQIISSFCEKILSNQFLPINATITSNKIRELNNEAFKQVSQFQSEFWTFQFEWRLGLQQLVFNPFKIKELAKHVSQFQPTYIQLLNLHDNDPKKFRSLKNLGEISIENSLQSMMISDIGWAFNYEEKDIRNFCQAATLTTKTVNNEILIYYLSSYFMPITKLSGVPFFKIGKIYATQNEHMKIKLIKSVKKNQIEQILIINEFFESSVLINSLSQRLSSKIKPYFGIKMDFISKRFMISQERDHQIQFNGELKDIILSKIQIL